MSNHQSTPTTARTMPTNKSGVVEAEHDFGVKDGKGRRIGAVVHTFEVDFQPVERGGYARDAGHYWAFTGNATRNRVMYGASQSPNYFHSAAERDAAMAKYLDAARKRAVRNFPPPDGTTAPVIVQEARMVAKVYPADGKPVHGSLMTSCGTVVQATYHPDTGHISMLEVRA
ncbi:hypothetical protein TMCBR3_gp045c [Caulobacter phage TMCBR3]|nr:hypothetical protein TMCBR3_gp045c [Caulobacter phage TMCBR3]